MEKEVPLKPAILGSALGDPSSPITYSGVPYHLFNEFRRRGCLVGVANSFPGRLVAGFHGNIDARRSLRERQIKSNALWRYKKKGMAFLSKRFESIQSESPPHNVVFQIGVGALPKPNVKLVAHVEISVATAIKNEVFAKSYGFDGHNPKSVKEAIEGEKHFLDRCSFVWTNSHWTAQGLREEGFEDERIKIYPPAAGIADPGIIERDWDKCHILFIGTQWHSKGGPLLLDAFSELRKINRNATLSIIGCDPKIKMEGVGVLGFLNKSVPKDRLQLEDILADSTVFCMPSSWESTGIVYMEAALYGLPVVMLRGQGREKIFPSSMAIHAQDATSKCLAEILIELSNSPDTMQRMGECGRQIVMQKYMWNKVAGKLHEDIQQIL